MNSEELERKQAAFAARIAENLARGEDWLTRWAMWQHVRLHQLPSGSIEGWYRVHVFEKTEDEAVAKLAAFYCLGYPGDEEWLVGPPVEEGNGAVPGGPVQQG